MQIIWIKYTFSKIIIRYFLYLAYDIHQNKKIYRQTIWDSVNTRILSAIASNGNKYRVYPIKFHLTDYEFVGHPKNIFLVHPTQKFIKIVNATDSVKIQKIYIVT